MIWVTFGNLRLRRNTGLFLTLGGVLGSAFGLWLYLRSARGGVLSATGASVTGTFYLRTQPIYLQADPNWAGERIGRSGRRFRRAGSAVCCLSMALAHHGVDLDPGALNAALTVRDGYARDGRVRWPAVARVTDGRAAARGISVPTHAIVRAAIQSGNPVAARVRLPAGGEHWVLLVGWRGGGYLMKDPLGDGKGVDPLTRYGSDIHEVWIVEKGQ